MKKTLKMIGILASVPVILLTLMITICMIINPYQYQINRHNNN